MALWIEDLIKVNGYTRPQYKLIGVRGIVVHYTATPGASAENERDYFNGTAIADKRTASAHIFVDKKEARLIVPLNEVAFHANDHACKIPALKGSTKRNDGSIYYGDANVTAIGVEMCIEKDGSLHPDTLARTVDVVAALCKTYKLDASDIYRHYDVTGKNCPAFWVDNPAGFTAFKKDVTAHLTGGTAPSTPTVQKPATSDKQIGTLEVLVSKLNVRKESNLNSAVVKTISAPDSYKVYAIENDMYNLGGDQWCSASEKYVKFTAIKPSFNVGEYQKDVIVTANSLNARSGRGTEFKVLGSFKQGEKVNVWYIAKTKDGSLWGSCSINGKTGYIHLGYVTPA